MVKYFHFDQFSSPLLIGFLQGLVFATILILRGRRQERLADFLGASILICGALYVAQWMFGFAGWYDSHDWRTTIMFYFPWNNMAFIGPLVWFYFRALTNAEFKFHKVHLWHFVIGGLGILETLIQVGYDFGYHQLIMGKAFEFFHGTRGPFSEWSNNNVTLFGQIMFWVIRLQFIAYLILTLVEFRKYRKYLQAEFSNAEQLTLNGLRYAIYLLFFGLSITVGINLLSSILDFSYQQSWYGFFVMSLVVYIGSLLFYRTGPNLIRQLRYQPAPVAISTATPEKTAVNSLAVDEEELHLWSTKLNKYLAEEEPYLNPELTLRELAKALKTNTSQLSKVINNVYEQNFNDFINSFRCKVFLAALEKGAHRQRTLLSLALDSGFNSKATFNRAFKKYYGSSPGEAARKIDETATVNTAA